MSHVINLSIMLIFLLSGNLMFSQYAKDTIYLNVSKDCNFETFKLKWMKPEGLQFNLCGNAVFLFAKGEHADTLWMDKLDLYAISTFKDVNQKAKDFRYKTYKKNPPNENDKAYQFYNKNDIFETFLIETINDKQFVVYPVKWRNQNVID